MAEDEATTTKMFYSADFFANLNSDASLYAGFHVHQLSTTSDVTGANDNTFSTLDMGPMFMWVMDHKRTYSFTAAYNILAKATNETTTSADWTGSSYLVSFGVTPELFDGWYVGFKLNYYSATYTEQKIGSAVTDVSNTRTMIFPTFVISYRK